MKNFLLKIYNYLRLYLFTIFSNISPNKKLKSNLVIFFKSAFLNILYSYKNIFINIPNKKFFFTHGNYWQRCINHLNFVGIYYDDDKLHKSPVINLTIINFNYKNRTSHDLRDAFFKNEKLNYFSKIIYKLFTNSNYNNILQWFGAYFYTFSNKTLSENQLKKLNNSFILEIGPGLGLNSLIYSEINKNEIFFYDLEQMSEIQKKIENSLRKKFQINKIKYFTDVDNLEAKLINKEYVIFSSYAFSEFPIKLREKFDNVIKNSKLSIFLSNAKFENIENKIYFLSLANKLKKNLEIKKFVYPSQDGYTKNHNYFILEN
tara:strand:+ start:1277 stop:2230 length:954 start_codon:yes stop_codon:yes gene_type:complete